MSKKQKNNLSLEELLFLILIIKGKEEFFNKLLSTYFFNEIIEKASRLSKDKNFLVTILKLERNNFNRLCNEKIKKLTKKD